MAWNKPTSGTVGATSSSRPTGRGKMPRLHKGILAGAIVVLGAGIAAWLLTNGEATSSSLKKKDRGLIKEVTPIKTSTNKVMEAEGLQIGTDKDEKPKLTRKQLRDIANGRRPWVPPAHTSMTFHLTREQKLFKNPADQAIAKLLSVEPGESIYGDPADIFGPKFNKYLQQTIANDIEISADDSEYDREVKLQVAEAKKEMFRRVREGEDAAQIMVDSYRELQQLGAYKEDLKSEVTKAIKDGSMSDDDVKDMLEAANRMLKERGISEMKMPSVFKGRLKLLEKKKQAGGQLK